MINYKLRKLNINDKKDLCLAANNVKVARYLRLRFPSPYAEKDAENYINYALKNTDEIILGIDINNKICGCISATFGKDMYIKSCELGYWLAEEFWGKGVMTSAIKEFCDFIFSNYKIRRIEAEIFSENIGSAMVLEKNKFHFEGCLRNKIYKNKNYYNAIIYALLKEDFYENIGDRDIL